MILETKQKLIHLADKYENSSFLEGDPSCYLRRYTKIVDVEVCSFIVAMLSFGRREQFLQKVKYILDLADSSCGSISQWLLQKKYLENFICDSNRTCKFYRFYSYLDLCNLFEELSTILKENSSLGEYLKKQYFALKQTNQTDVLLSTVVSNAFKNSKIVPHGKTSANKRVNLFLRWMVRQNSPVDLGIWNWYSSENLVIPLDVHVICEAQKLNLLPQNATANAKSAILLTDELKQIWPKDPCKGDFALFGLGIDS